MDLKDADIRQDYIQRYLEGSLSEDELILFEKELLINSSLKNELDLVNVIHSKEKDALKTLLQEEKDTPIKKVVEKRSTRPMLWAAAAAIAIILGTAFWMASSDRNTDLLSKEIEINHASPVVLLDISQDENIEWNSAINDYLKQDYQSFISTLKAIEQSKNLTSEQSYYLAIAYLRTGDFFKAKDLLQMLQKKNDNFSEEVKWYLALTHLKLSENSSAKEILNEIVSTKSFKWKTAQKLLEENEK